MAWRYENPGYRELLVVPGHTVECDSTKSKTGYAFWQNYRSKSFDIPSAKEIWAKFDVYSASGTSNRWRVYNENAYYDVNGITILNAQINIWTSQDSSNPVGSYDVKSWTGLHTIILHMVSDASNGIVEFFFDGEKAASATGKNVNNGNPFNNFFLESDGADVLFSNVIISDTELTADDTCDLSKKPWIQPVIGKNGTFGVDDFAVRRSDNSSNIYKVFDATDTGYGSRAYIDFYIKENVSIKSVCVSNVVNSPNASFTGCTLSSSDDGNMFDAIKTTNKDSSSTYTIFDIDGSQPKHYYRIYMGGDYSVDGIIIHAESSKTANVFLDTSRRIMQLKSVLIYTSRKIGNTINVSVDTNRNIGEYYNIDFSADTERAIKYITNIDNDTSLSIVRTVSIDNDISRTVNIGSLYLFDVSLNVYKSLALSVDLSRDTGKIGFDADVVRDVYVSHIDVLEDTIRRMPYLIDNNDVQSITLTIEEHTVSDTMSISLIGDYVPKDGFMGKFLDYAYNMMVLSTTREKDGIIQNVNAVNDFYKFNFCKMRYFVYSETGERLKASQFLRRIAEMIGYKSSVMIDDYEPKMKVNGNGYEYREDSNLDYGKELRYESYPQMLTSIFGWTQQLPWRQINVFAHDGVLYAIQRGKEPNIVDLTSRKITRPHIEQTLYSQDAEFYEFEYLVPGKSYISGHTGGERYQEFAHNLLNGSLDTQYDSYGNITHTVGKLNGDGGENLTAYTDYMHEYDAEGNILSTVTDVTVYNSQNEVVDRYSSGSVDAGNRNSAYMMTNGDTMIAGTTAGHPTNKPFADESFTWSTAPTAFYFCKVDAYGNRSKKFKLHDMPEKTFPIGNEKNLLDFCTGYDSSYGKIKSLFHELMAYNQKIQETLTFDIVDPISDGDMSNIHIIDMRDKIKLNGNIYYLERNVVTLTKKSLRQSLSIVRWF